MQRHAGQRGLRAFPDAVLRRSRSVLALHHPLLLLWLVCATRAHRTPLLTQPGVLVLAACLLVSVCLLPPSACKTRTSLPHLPPRVHSFCANAHPNQHTLLSAAASGVPVSVHPRPPATPPPVPRFYVFSPHPILVPSVLCRAFLCVHNRCRVPPCSIPQKLQRPPPRAHPTGPTTCTVPLTLPCSPTAIPPDPPFLATQRPRRYRATRLTT